MEPIANVTFIRHFPQHGMSIVPRPVARTRKDAPAAEQRRDDDDLVERVALGDVDAAAQLKDRHAGRLARIAHAILGDEAETDRVVEAVFEEACLGWPPERGEVERWLTRLVRRRARRRRRILMGCDA